MTTEIKRDLAVDLAICETARPGPWRAELSVPERGDRRPAVLTHFDDYWQDEFIHADFACMIDAKFAAEAREGWPHAIRRAIAAETERDVEERRRRTVEAAADDLAYDNVRLRKSLSDVLVAVDRGDLVRVKMSSGIDYVITRAREALEDE